MVYRDTQAEIKAQITKSKKLNNATRLYYYEWLLSMGFSACSGYDQFIGSWAGQEWFNKNKNNIQSMADESNKRFQTYYKVYAPN